MSAKETAIRDIKIELLKECRNFISFRTELNPAIRKIVKRYSIAQERIAYDKA